MASEFDNNIGNDSEQNELPNQDEQQQQTDELPENDLSFDENDEENQVWGDDDDDVEPPPNPLEIEDDESKFIGENGDVEESANEAEEETQQEGDEREPNNDNGKQLSSSEQSNPQPPINTSDSRPVNPDQKYVDRIYPEYIPGTNEFFSGVEIDARKAVEESTGEEFDEFNPQHMSRFNYYASLAAKKREDEGRRGIEYLKREEQQIAQIQKQKEVEKNFGEFLNKQITSKELADRFQEACDNLTVRQTREINAKIEKGDYSGVQRIIDGIKGRRGNAQPRYASQNPRPVRTYSNSGNNAPKLSDIL